jgi:palmitoyltransferase
MESFSFSALAVLAALLLISFLSFSSQYLFLSFEPLGLEESILFNVSIACLLISYFRAIVTDPGRIQFPKGDGGDDGVKSRQRWCRKCEQRKPPRAHHCKVCKR